MPPKSSKRRRTTYSRYVTGDKPVDGTPYEVTKQPPSTETERYYTYPQLEMQPVHAKESPPQV